MIQTSLLVKTDTPSEPDALGKWVERVRGRLVSISNQICTLENEKRSLLAKLQEAGLSSMPLELNDTDRHLPERETTSRTIPSCVRGTPVVSVNESVPVVDLLESSQSQIVPDSDADNKMDLDLAQNYPPPSPPSDESGDTELRDSVLDDLDPRELSFDLDHIDQSENDPPQNVCTDSNSRVYKLDDFHEIDWEAITPVELKQWLQLFGVKPALGGRKMMVNKLRDIFNYIMGNSESSPITTKSDAHADDDSRHSLFRCFRTQIMSNSDLYEKIVCFETVDVAQVYIYLTQVVSDKSFSIKHVKEYLDRVHVQYCTTSEKFKKRRPKLNAIKKVRCVRKSISCPT